MTKIDCYKVENPEKSFWEMITIKLNKLINLIVFKSEDICTCGEYIKFNDNILLVEQIKMHFNLKLNSIVNSNLNSIPINYENSDFHPFCIKVHEVLTKYKKTISDYVISFDLLGENTRIKYIKTAILGEIVKPKYKENSCFLCDKVCDKIYPCYIKNNCITETEICYEIRKYPILHRCLDCKNKNYGNFLITTDKMCIMVRHYKWMTFYSGIFDNNSLLYSITQDIMWIIIMLYQTIRNL